MEQLAVFPEESWQHVVCRICRHPFAIAVEDAEAAPVVLCQTCTLLVEWFGQDEAPPDPAPAVSTKAKAPPTPAHIAAAKDEALPKRASKAPKKARQQVELGMLLERWGDLWQSSEEQSNEEQL